MCKSRPENPLIGLSWGLQTYNWPHVSTPSLSSCKHNIQWWDGPGILIFYSVKHCALLSAAGAKTTRQSGVIQMSCHITDTPEWNQKAFMRMRLIPVKRGAPSSTSLEEEAGQTSWVPPPPHSTPCSFLSRERESITGLLREKTVTWHSLAIFWHRIWECCDRRKVMTDHQR